MKPIKVTAEDIKREIDNYILEKPGEKLSASAISKYMKCKGYEIEAHTIRRREGIPEYINAINNKCMDDIIHEVVVYKTLDINELFSEYSRDALKQVIADREKYYRDIASSAAVAFDKVKSAERSVAKYKAENIKLREELKTKNNKDQTNAFTFKELRETIKILKEIIDNNINKEMANALLERDGILECVNSLLSENTVEKNLITANTDITNFISNANDTKSKLMEIFDE